MLNSSKLIHSILSTPWAISPQHAHKYYANLSSLLFSDTPIPVVSSHEDSATEGYASDEYPYLVSYSTSGARISYSGLDSSNKGNVVAVIPVIGPIMKYDSCGDPGTDTIEAWVRKAGNDINVRGIVLNFDTPGGTVNGTPKLAETVAEVSKKKPVIAFVDSGMMCSAGYWIGSQATEIVASYRLDLIGSIGVFTTYMDFNAAMSAKYGNAKIEDIYSRLSTEKNIEFKKWLADDKAPTQDYLDTIASDFIAVVKSGRGDRLMKTKEDPFKGGSFYATEALDMGLIDSIGNIDFAMNRVFQLSEPSAANPSSNANSNHNDTMSKISLVAYPAILSALNMSAENATEVEFTAEHLTAINAAMVKTAGELTTTTTQLATKTTEAVQLTTDLAAANATIATYGRKPGADASNPPKGQETLNAENQNLIDSLPHNKNADELLGVK